MKSKPPKRLCFAFRATFLTYETSIGLSKQITGEQKAAASVEFSLKDAESGEDTVPIFSAAQTPIAQNSVVESIIGEIRASRIRLVELAATNVLDSLFLADVLREQCPDTRLLIDEPNLLVRQRLPRPNLSTACSRFPLIPSFQAPGFGRWTRQAAGIRFMKVQAPKLSTTRSAHSCFNPSPSQT